jgi:hypothetical protein
MSDAILPHQEKNFQSVYVAASESGLVKIGISFDPEERIKALLTGHGVGLSVAHIERMDENIARLVERTAHRLLSDHRSNGEWFKVSADVAISTVSMATSIVADCKKSIPPEIVEKLVYMPAERKKTWIISYVEYYNGVKPVLLWSLLCMTMSIFSFSFTDLPSKIFEYDRISAIILAFISLFSIVYPMIGVFLHRRTREQHNA